MTVLIKKCSCSEGYENMIGTTLESCQSLTAWYTKWFYSPSYPQMLFSQSDCEIISEDK